MKPLLHASVTGETKQTDPEPLLYDLSVTLPELGNLFHMYTLIFLNLYLVDFVHLNLNKVPS